MFRCYSVPVLAGLLKESMRYVLKELILFIKFERPSKVAKRLRIGDELCRGSRLEPMSSELIEKERDIEQRIQTKNNDTGLVLALSMGLMNMAWGFIQCAIQTNSDLWTGQRGDYYVENYFWYSNDQMKTAFDIAVEKNHLEVASILLSYLISDWGSTDIWRNRKEDILRLLNDPRNDRIIFNILEGEKEERDEKEGRELLGTAPVTIYGQRDIYKDGSEEKVEPTLIDLYGDGLAVGCNNTAVIHLAAKIGNVACIEYLLEQNPSQIYFLNSDTETPAYVAAREGRVDTLRFMIRKIRDKNEDIEPIVTRSIDKKNALHIAIQNHHLEVIFLLVNEIPQLANRINDSGESPLYLAAKRGYYRVIELMFNKCQDMAFEGPIGETAVHAAAISGSKECMVELLRRRYDLINNQDKRGWTPLRHAVYHNNSLAVLQLLSYDLTSGYKLYLEHGIYTSAIQIAASRGHCETMEALMLRCPGCSDFIDIKGRNMLHVAVENKKDKAIELIFRHKSLTNLINQKDKNGNTPVHLLVASNFEMMEMLMDSRVNIMALNNEKLTPLDMVSSDDQRDRLIKAITKGTSIHNKTSASSPTLNKSGLNETEREKTDKHFVVVDSLVVVAALIATASFAAAFTVPGGFDSSDGSKQGTPFLLKKSAFQAFMITNAIAFSSSCSVLLGHIALVFYRNRYDEASIVELEYINSKIEAMYYLTTLALFAMTIAFVTGLYVVLTLSLGLAISVCSTSLLIILINMHKDSFGRSRKAGVPSLLIGKLLCG